MKGARKRESNSRASLDSELRRAAAGALCAALLAATPLGAVGCASSAARNGGSAGAPAEAPAQAQPAQPTPPAEPAAPERGKLEPRYQPREPEPEPWYNDSYLFGMTRGVTNSTIHPAAQVPLLVLTIPLDIVFLPFAAIGGLF